MHYQSLLRRGVRPLSRDAAFILDPAVRMRFRHKGGESSRGPQDRGGSGARCRLVAA